jgi:hypothetical protein
MEEDLIIETWDLFKEYISEKAKDTAASHYVDFLLSKDIELTTLEGLTGYDASLDTAINLVLDENRDESDEDEEDNWDFDEADEDY